MTTKKHSVEPHGGNLIDLLKENKIVDNLREANELFSLEMNSRQLCDLELLINGGYSPLSGFMNQDQYMSVCREMRLGDGLFWPIPITLDITENLLKDLKLNKKIALRDPEGVVLAVMEVEDIWSRDADFEADTLYDSKTRKNVEANLASKGPRKYYIGGKIQGIESPVHHDFPSLRLKPAEVRHEFERLGWLRIMGFFTSTIIHRMHHAYLIRASLNEKANLLIHGISNSQLLPHRDYFTRIRCYKAMLPYFPNLKVLLTLLPYFHKNMGLKEMLLQAIISKNHGCTHFVLNPDEITSPNISYASAEDFQEVAINIDNFKDKIGIKLIPYQSLVYVKDLDKFEDKNTVPKNMDTVEFSDSNFIDKLKKGQTLPKWVTFPEVLDELTKNYPPRHKQGFTVFFTGLSGSGKSTLAKVLRTRLLQLGDRPVTLLDGDIVRKNLSSELGFSKAHRNLNIKRIGFVASEITKNYGIAICAPIAPYNKVRSEVRSFIESNGGFVLVYVSTPLEVCEQRDRKGLYAKARAGEIKEFTGISDPYEPPADADIIIDTSDLTPDEAVWEIMIHLEKQGFIGGREIERL